MPDKTARHEVQCPHPDCGAKLKISDTLPAGEYPCICRGCTVRVGWAHSLETGPYPYVSLVLAQGQKSSTT